ncbi:hypothetical protein AAGS40_30100 (plasmid) [Paraburkholderia sp. PREW-6R]|uniref:hypothetical protein n=1 Tax=Paraburkholderia sp. PREW-6R TaxID=3141544 RepID=UPI0031F4D6B2
MADEPLVEHLLDRLTALAVRENDDRSELVASVLARIREQTGAGDFDHALESVTYVRELLEGHPPLPFRFSRDRDIEALSLLQLNLRALSSAQRLLTPAPTSVADATASSRVEHTTLLHNAVFGQVDPDPRGHLADLAKLWTENAERRDSANLTTLAEPQAAHGVVAARHVLTDVDAGEPVAASAFWDSARMGMAAGGLSCIAVVMAVAALVIA